MPSEVASAGPEWLVILIVILVGLNFAGRVLSEASETWARLLGPLGRRWRERGIRRQEERAAERQVRQADLEDMTRQRDSLDSSLVRCQREGQLQGDYIEYDARWHRDTRLAAIEAGCDKLLDHQSFLQWRKGRDA